MSIAKLAAPLVDFTIAAGKAPAGVAPIARELKEPVHAIGLAACYGTLVLLDFEPKRANVLTLMVFHSGAMKPSQIKEKYDARGPSRKFRATTRVRLTKKTRAHVIVDEDIEPRSSVERTRQLILAAVRLWELKRGIRN